MIYCIDCKWYRESSIKSLGDFCIHPSNLKNTYRACNDSQEKEPEELNKNNSCKNFEKKEYEEPIERPKPTSYTTF